MASPIELVGKIGSMALIRREEKDIDYNIFSRLGAELRPGMIWVSSGAVEIGRLDYIKRTGHELTGVTEQDKVDYSAQGQTILMNTYRQFIRPEYGIRQVLVEHTHFNDPLRREHIHRMLLRAAAQEVIPIINYNDPVSDEEVRKMELASRRAEGMEVVECVDNDETAEVVAQLVENNLIANVADLYDLHAQDVAQLDRMGAKSAENLIRAIEKSKANDLSKLIYGLGIRQVGEKAAAVLARHFGTLDAMTAASVEELTEIPDVGEITAKCIVDYLNQPQAKDLIARLKAAGVNMDSTVQKVDDRFAGMTFVLTGTLSRLDRKTAEAEIALRGGKASGSVSKKTTYVVAGENAGSKLRKAQELNIPVLTEDEFLTMLQ